MSPRWVSLRWTRAAIFLPLAVCALAAPPAQGEGPPPRPKIGIAFSGGGAKGCAHIGVLRVLEEMRIPVDYAAGTSMGAIVGGLYASGMDPDRLEEAIVTVDWADALRDKPGRRDLVFRRKDDDLRYIPDLELGIGRGGLRYPAGLRSGQKLSYLLRRFTLPVRTVRDFDRLPIPFRAVATDITTGQMVVLGRGDLSRALRASMAIPTFFSPVELDGKLLVDGGVTDNMPVDVVRAMGADVVIAIDIGSQFAGEEEVGKSFLSILGQTNLMITRGNMIARLADANIVITPDVNEFGTLEFNRGPEIIARGETEARRQADALRPYALSEEEYRSWKASHRRAPDAVPLVTAVRFEGNRRVDTRVLAAQVRTRPGSPFSADATRDDLERIFGLGDFETVDGYLEPEGDEGSPGAGTAVVYRVHEKPWGPTYLRAGIGFQSDIQGTNDLALLGAANWTRINALGAEWKTELQFGGLRVLQTEFYQPLSFRKGWFIAPSASYRRRTLKLFTNGEPVAELDVAAQTSKLDLGYTFGRHGEARLGLERGSLTPHRESGILADELAGLDGTTFTRAGLTLSAVVDRLDSATLPKNGTLARLAGFYSLAGLGAKDEYSKLELRSSRYWTRGRHTLFGGLGAGYSSRGELPIYDRFALGGLFSLSGYELNELTGNDYGLLRLGYYYRVGKILHLGGYLEGAGVAGRFGDVTRDPILTATALAVADTALGPLYLGIGVGEPGRTKAYIVFGRQF